MHTILLISIVRPLVVSVTTCGILEVNGRGSVLTKALVVMK